MARKKVRDPRKEKYWRAQVARQAGSALSIRRWCRRENLSESMFHWWKRELAARDRQGRTPAPAEDAPLRFTEIVVPGSLGPSPPPPSPPLPFAGSIEIVLAGGHRIRVGSGFDAQDLSRVLSVLAGAKPC